MAVFEYAHVTFKLPPTTAFPDGHSVSRPVLIIGISNGENRINHAIAVVDSGADYCTFPASFLPHLGIDVDTLGFGSASGISQGHDIFFATVRLHFQDLGEWDVYAGFVHAMTDHGMLGHSGFLERFKVTLDAANFRYQIEPSVPRRANV